MMRTTSTLAMAVFLAACSDTAGSKSTSSADAAGGGRAAIFESGAMLRVAVPETGRVFIRLSTASIVTFADDAKTSVDWDLALEGFDVFTNGGVSGAGEGAAFGPLDALEFLGDVAPEVPFLTEDKTGGAFLDWYAYDSTSHALFSRYHVFGVQDGDRRWKVQVIGYCGERDGAVISALYRLRYAEVSPGRAGTMRELAGVDGTAGGAAAPRTAPSECLDLGTDTRTMLTPDEAQQSSAWHLCFRRASIMVNGEVGGPRGVGAVDLGANGIAGETLDAIKARTRDGMMPAFEAVTDSSFEGKVFRGDHVVSGFGDKWIDRTPSAVEPAFAAWLVRDATGRQKFLVAFTSFEAPGLQSAGVVVMRVKPVKG